MSEFCANSLIANMEKGFRAVFDTATSKKDTSMITNITINSDTNEAGRFNASLDCVFSTEFAAVDGFEPTKVNVGASIDFHRCYYAAATGELEFKAVSIGFYSQGRGEWYAKSDREEGGDSWSLCDINNDDVRLFYDHDMLFDEYMVEIALENAFNNSAKTIYPLQQAISERILAHYQASLTPADIEQLTVEQKRVANLPVHKSIQIKRAVSEGFAQSLGELINNEKTVVQESRFERCGDDLFFVSLRCKFTTEFEPVEGFEPTKVDVNCHLSDIKYYLNADTNKWEWLDGEVLIGLILPCTGAVNWYRQDTNGWHVCDVDLNDVHTPIPFDVIPFGSEEDNSALSGLQTAFEKQQAIKYQIVSSISEKALFDHLKDNENTAV